MPARPTRRTPRSSSCSLACPFARRFLSTVGRPSAVALCFVHVGLFTEGLSPSDGCPCWAHMEGRRKRRERMVPYSLSSSPILNQLRNFHTTPCEGKGCGQTRRAGSCAMRRPSQPPRRSRPDRLSIAPEAFARAPASAQREPRSWVPRVRAHRSETRPARATRSPSAGRARRRTRSPIGTPDMFGSRLSGAAE